MPTMGGRTRRLGGIASACCAGARSSMRRGRALRLQLRVLPELPLRGPRFSVGGVARPPLISGPSGQCGSGIREVGQPEPGLPARADLYWANLSGADLGRAGLSGAKVTDVQLAQAKSIAGATIPDGTKHE